MISWWAKLAIPHYAGRPGCLPNIEDWQATSPVLARVSFIPVSSTSGSRQITARNQSKSKSAAARFLGCGTWDGDPVSQP